MRDIASTCTPFLPTPFGDPITASQRRRRHCSHPAAAPAPAPTEPATQATEATEAPGPRGRGAQRVGRSAGHRVRQPRRHNHPRSRCSLRGARVPCRGKLDLVTASECKVRQEKSKGPTRLNMETWKTALRCPHTHHAHAEAVDVGARGVRITREGVGGQPVVVPAQNPRHAEPCSCLATRARLYFRFKKSGSDR